MPRTADGFEGWLNSIEGERLGTPSSADGTERWLNATAPVAVFAEGTGPGSNSLAPTTGDVVESVVEFAPGTGPGSNSLGPID